MAINNFIPSVWSETLYEELGREYVGVANCSRDFEGDIRAQGDTVKIGGITGVTTFAYTKNTDFASTLQTLSDSTRSLQISQARGFNFQIDDIDRAQQNPKLMRHAMAQAAAALAGDADSYVYSLYSSVAAAQTIAVSGVTTALIPDLLLAAREMLSSANVPAGAELTLEVPPAVATRVIKAQLSRSTDNTEALANGCIGRFLGFRVCVSGNVASTTTNGVTTYHCFARTGRAVTFAEQLNQVEAYRPENRFADAVKGLHLYGAKIVYPSELVLLDLSLAAIDSLT